MYLNIFFNFIHHVILMVKAKITKKKVILWANTLSKSKNKNVYRLPSTVLVVEVFAYRLGFMSFLSYHLKRNCQMNKPNIFKVNNKVTRIDSNYDLCYRLWAHWQRPTVLFHKISTPEDQVKVRYITQWAFRILLNVYDEAYRENKDNR